MNMHPPTSKFQPNDHASASTGNWLRHVDDVPVDLDPVANPTITLHWFGLDPDHLAEHRRQQRLGVDLRLVEGAA